MSAITVITAAAPVFNDSAMVALGLPDDLTGRLAAEGGLDRDDMHVTVLYLGKLDSLNDEYHTDARLIAEAVAEHSGPISGQLTRLSHFGPEEDGRVAVVLELDSETAHELHDDLASSYDAVGVPFSKKYPEYKPHVTIGYWHPDEMPEQYRTPGPLAEPIPFEASGLNVHWGGAIEGAALTASGRTTAANAGYPHGKSVKWAKVYEGLRRRGMSKEKAARISNAQYNRYRRWGRAGDPGQKSMAQRREYLRGRRKQGLSATQSLELAFDPEEARDDHGDDPAQGGIQAAAGLPPVAGGRAEDLGASCPGAGEPGRGRAPGGEGDAGPPLRAVQLLAFKYNPQEPRDEDGQWTAGPHGATGKDVGARIAPNGGSVDTAVFHDIEVSMESLDEKTRAGVLKTAHEMYGESPEDTITKNYEDLLEDARHRTNIVDPTTGAVIREVEPGDFFDESRHWYNAANEAAHNISDSVGGAVHWTQVSGVIAATSPQQKWEANVKFAQRLVEYTVKDMPLDITHEQLHGVGDPKKMGLLEALKKAQDAGRLPADFDLSTIKQGVRPSDISDPLVTAFVFGAMSKAHGWKVQISAGYDKPAAAIEILRGVHPDQAIRGSKIRSFHNNIQSPDKPTDVTIDTIMMKAGKVGRANQNKGGTAEAESLSDPLITRGNSTPKLTRLLPGHEGEAMVKSGPGKNTASTDIGVKPLLGSVAAKLGRKYGLTAVEVQAIVWSEFRQQNPSTIQAKTTRAKGEGIDRIRKNAADLAERKAKRQKKETDG